MASNKSNMTPLQKRLLQQYQSFEQTPPTLGSLIALSARGHIRIAILFAAATALCFGIGIAPVGYAMIGMLVGAISRDFGQFWKHAHVWPIVSRIIDWQKLSALLCNEQPNPKT